MNPSQIDAYFKLHNAQPRGDGMEKTYEVATMTFMIDKFDEKVSVGGFVHHNTRINVADGIKTITIHKIERITAWFDNGDDVDLYDSYLDKEAFIKQAEMYLTEEFLR